MINDNAVPEKQILALSFSSKAAKEMKNRLIERLGIQANRIEVRTFHSFGLQIIRNHYYLVGLNESFNFADNTEKNRILRKVLKENQISEKNIVEWAKKISILKRGQPTNYYQESKIINDYQAQLRLLNMIDFDDMIVLALRILSENDEISKAYQSEYLHILVDEVQDLSKNQIGIIKHIVNNSNSLFVVGDDDQCIYEWRGAEPRILKNLESDSEFEIIRLEENFRSDSKIVDISSMLINHNENRIGKQMRSGRLRKRDVDVSSISAHRFIGFYNEASFIAEEI